MAAEANPMTTYSFEVPDEVWEQWKDTVPRSQRLDERLIELIEADTKGDVTDGDLNAVRADLERALEHQEWGAVNDALARLGGNDD